ncbi:MAG: nucleotide exchange factor GrpE [Candidatus Moranbacteria bacterium]|nr:nucleotide exchange factor GrpE [Candidatus Moranbacteria bacterium]
MSEEKKYPEPIVGALIVNNEGKILLAKGKKWGGKYTCFGGHVEMGESLKKAVVREAKEETSLDVEIIGEMGFNESIFEKDFHKKKHFVFIDFVCKYDGDEALVETNEEFEKEFKWFNPDDALKQDLANGTKHLLEKYIQSLKGEGYLDSWKRCQADFENYKKGQAKRQEDFRKFAKMDVIEQILPVVDNFEASLAHVPEEKKENGWVEGIVYIKKQLEDVLRNNDIEEISVKAGDDFDPGIHEAMAGKGEKVKKVLQKGYRLNGRIVRAARVEVE